MKILIIGSGGREHTIAWKIHKNPCVTELYCAPGNGGISKIATCVPICEEDIVALRDFALDREIDLTIVGSETPLVAGIVDLFHEKSLKIFGPTKQGAVLEGSKAFSKAFMKKHQIPTSEYDVYLDANEAISSLVNRVFPVVIKADGLAKGKGVMIADTLEEAKLAIQDIMVVKTLGEAGNQIVIEEHLTGREVSVLAFCDGEHIIPMASAQDHKRALDGDLGLNTGGMGTFSPSPYYTPDIEQYCIDEIYIKTVRGLREEGVKYQGIIFFGLMLTEKGPKVIEYNVRFGDPEAQVVLTRMKNDLIDVIIHCLQGTLNEVKLEFEEGASVCVVLASKGYPEHYETGFEIHGQELLEAKQYYGFHAGTKCDNHKIITTGGRVMGVTARGSSLREARENAYKGVQMISYSNKYYRTDIGKDFQ